MLVELVVGLIDLIVTGFVVVVSLLREIMFTFIVVEVVVLIDVAPVVVDVLVPVDISLRTASDKEDLGSDRSNLCTSFGESSIT